ERVKLVLRVSLPCQAKVVVLVIPVGESDPIEVRYVEQLVRALVVVGALDVLLRAPVSVRGIEPEPVTQNRTTERTAVVLELLDRRAGLQSSRPQVTIE